MQNKRLVPIIVIGVITFLVVVGLSSSIFYKVNSGERAVIFRQFTTGLDKENIILPGFGVKSPWNDIYIYDVKENTTEEDMPVLDKNGLSINVEVTIRFHPKFDQIGDLHEKFEQNFVSRIVIPELRSAVRQVTGRYTAEEIYSTKRSEVEAEIKTETEKALSANHISMRALLIRSINLPVDISQAIENKLKQEQEALAYQFRLEREKSEAERKKIAAEGEAVANNIVSNSFTDRLLKMRGIEATLELAKSPNTKVVIVGSGDDGLPLILGGN